MGNGHNLITTTSINFAKPFLLNSLLDLVFPDQNSHMIFYYANILLVTMAKGIC